MKMSEASLNTRIEWNTLNWAKIQRKVFKLQKQIFRAVKSGNKVKARKLQKLLSKSFYAKLLSVRKVTQDNQGRKTAGVDGQKSLTSKQRILLAHSLTRKGYKAKPLRRVWIPKPGKDEKRPLGIPTIRDRAMQALVKLALEPYWEALFEPNSYGFRPGRSAHDAIDAIYQSINQKDKYVLDADIAGCFDNIDHYYLLQKLDCPYFRSIIKQWLNAGVMDNGVFKDTYSGTPQGGIISPLLANIALDGLENYLKDWLWNVRKYRIPNNSGGIYNQVATKRSLSFIRYADDFVVLHKDPKIVKEAKELISQWLKQVGLELKPSKTRLCHTLNDHEGEKAGFDFLGFNIRQYSAGKYHSGTSSNGKLLGFKTRIKPSSKAIKTHREKIKQIVKSHKNASQSALISKLNPIIRGWSNYFSSQCSKETFSSEDHQLWIVLRAWALSRSKKGKKEAIAKYFRKGKGDGKWTFKTLEGLELAYHSPTPIKRHTKVKGDASPYDGNWPYWSKRRGEYVRLVLSEKAPKGL